MKHRILLLLALAMTSTVAGAQISFVGQCTGTTSCASVPAHKPGDLFVSYQGRDASTTASTLPTGWTSAGTASINGTSTADSVVRVACKIANSSSETATGFTSAGALVVQIYRGTNITGAGTCGALGTPVFTSTAINTTSTTETFGAVTNAASTSWDVGFGYAPAATGGMGTAPSGMTHRATSGTIMGGQDTNAGVASFSSAGVTTTTASRIITAVVEIQAYPAVTTPSNLVQEYHSGHFAKALAATGCVSPCTITIFPPNTTLSSNLLRLVTTTCGGTAWDSCSATPPAISSITDNIGNTWTADASEVNATDFETTTGFHVCGATAGVTAITVHFASGNTADFQYDFAEYRNIATSSCTDGTAAAISAGPGGSATALVTPGSLTTTADGDMIETYAILATNGITSAPASGIFLNQNALLNSGDFAESQVSEAFIQTTHGAITPYAQITNTNAQNFNAIATAFKVSAGAGTAATITPRVVHANYTATTANAAQTVLMPVAGNTIVAGSSNISQALTALSDDKSNTYTILATTGFPTLAYACNVTGGNPVTMTITSGTLTGSWFMVYDVTGAATSCFDSTMGKVTASGTQSGTSNISSAPSVTPSSSNGIVFVINGYGTGPGSNASPGVLDCPYYATEDDSDKTCNGDSFAHYNNPNTSAENWTWTMANGSGGSSWNAVAAAFLGAGGASNSANISDSSTSSPAVAASAGRSASLSASVTTAPAVAASAGRSAAISETSTSAPAVVVRSGRSAAISETSTSAPAVTASAGHNAAPSDTSTSSPAVSAALGRGAPLSDTSTSAPAVTAQAAHNASISETSTSAPAVTAVVGRNVALSDTSTSSPAVAVGHGAPMADTSTSAPAVTAQATHAASLSDTSTSAPAVTASAGRSTSLAQSMTSAAALATQSGKGAPMSDASTSAPAVVAQAAHNAAPGDNSTSAPSVQVSTGRSAVLAQSTTTSPALTIQSGKSKTMADASASAPAVAVQAGRNVALAQSSSSADAVSVVVQRGGQRRRMVIIGELRREQKQGKLPA